MKKKYKVKNHKKRFIILTITCFVLFLTIGFSAFSTELNMDGLYAVVRIQKDIRITNVYVNNVTSNAESEWEAYNINNIASYISLPNSNSTISFDVEITNVGNTEASISAITGLPSNLTYSLSNYNLRDVLCDDTDSTQCKLGSVSTITVTIGYATNGYNSNNTDYLIKMDFDFSYMVDSVARIGNQYFDTLQDAIDAVPDDKTETEVFVLKNCSELITIENNKNVVLNLNGKTLSNNGNLNVIVNKGILKLTGGTVSSNAPTQGAINNESAATIIINNNRVVMTGGRQALYNNKGTATISGNSYLSSSATERAAVQNLGSSTLNILGGTIVSTGSSGVQNAGTLTIGTKDGNINNYPVLQGVIYGITTTTNVNFYDGIFKGITAAINQTPKIVDIETGVGIVNDTETIDNVSYKTLYLAVSSLVTFHGNGGNVSESTRYVPNGREIGQLPVPTRNGYAFLGWFTSSDGGTQVTENSIINAETHLYAHWEKLYDVAAIGSTKYDTLQNAITAATNNTQTTITLLKDVKEQITITGSKNIILDLNNKTLSNNGKNSVVENSGTTTIINGTITSNTDVGAINNNGGVLTISTDANIIATGTRQAIYINNGIVEITSNAYLSSENYGIQTTTTMERGTIQCLINGTVNITGGTIVSNKQQAVSNEGSLTIGTKDGNINSTTPVLIGEVNGIRNDGTFNFYDGIIKGKTASIDGSITDQEVNSQLVNGTETINGSVYNTAHLTSS